MWLTLELILFSKLRIYIVVKQMFWYWTKSLNAHFNKNNNNSVCCCTRELLCFRLKDWATVYKRSRVLWETQLSVWANGKSEMLHLRLRTWPLQRRPWPRRNHNNDTLGISSIHVCGVLENCLVTRHCWFTYLYMTYHFVH